jgi:TfoX/Sxy family transcriptional regulator of competence genes
MAYDEDAATRLRKLLASRSDVTERKLMGGLCFMVNGHMCCSASGRGGLLVRVGRDMHAQMSAEPHAQPAEMRGRIMTGYVRVAPEGYRTDADLKEWLKRGLDFVATMPPKPAARKKVSRRIAPKQARSPR